MGCLQGFVVDFLSTLDSIQQQLIPPFLMRAIELDLIEEAVDAVNLGVD